jgi:anhydro-N-acetylmuramic acid kinase
VIAELTGVTTVGDFRKRDMAVGGTGAPLVPRAEQLLFEDRRYARGFLNIGGIANLTGVPPEWSADPVIAFDTGPGNSLIDEAVSIVSKGKKSYDRNGLLARSGRLDSKLLETLMRHPYLRKSPPKATGKEEFGRAFLDGCVNLKRRSSRRKLDAIFTLTYFTALSIHLSWRRFVRPVLFCDRLYVSGGGVRNRTLMKLLQTMFCEEDAVTVDRIESLGVASRAKEALCFAVLAWMTAHGMPGNVPSVTGATRSTVLGKISPGKKGWLVW